MERAAIEVHFVDTGIQLAESRVEFRTLQDLRHSGNEEGTGPVMLCDPGIRHPPQPMVDQSVLNRKKRMYREHADKSAQHDGEQDVSADDAAAQGRLIPHRVPRA
jgi:hypothetical protein